MLQEGKLIAIITFIGNWSPRPYFLLAAEKLTATKTLHKICVNILPIKEFLYLSIGMKPENGQLP